ncbi:Smr/MutS family protein [Caproiciproducens galactitolivorans]|uniref:Smr/MutS family protein n=1 Tax=Caproiciproducens galactitolivorans TaxID=642589 RepID=UPI0010847BBE|nr:Smr/MutS family protein [Caproiciproducens galactitolivorans]QEY35335.1 Smr/MutS family protein [Caproiciproducens galactitolivorans]
MLQERHGNLLEVNIHGMTVEEAKRSLEQLLNRADAKVTEIRVIHGYNSGQALRDMVRLRLKHPRIAAKLICLNPGETRILLQKRK